MKPINQSHLMQKYRGKWVALQPDQQTVITSGESAASVLSSAKKQGCETPVVTRIPQDPARFIGAF